MPMTANGYAKLLEELGELAQVAAKRLAYFTTDDHPDGGAPLNERFEDEAGDVLAALQFVVNVNGLDNRRIHRRAGRKLALFRKWHAEPDNNAHGLQIPSESAP